MPCLSRVFAYSSFMSLTNLNLELGWDVSRVKEVKLLPCSSAQLPFPQRTLMAGTGESGSQAAPTGAKGLRRQTRFACPVAPSLGGGHFSCAHPLAPASEQTRFPPGATQYTQAFQSLPWLPLLLVHSLPI